MIPPSLMNGSFLFTLIPIWEPAPAPSPPCPDDPAATPAEADAASDPEPRSDADGVNDQVALRMVFKGFRLAVVTDWQAEAFTGYERWVENRADDDAERERQNQRARGAVRPNPHTPSGPEQAGTAPSASSAGDE